MTIAPPPPGLRGERANRADQAVDVLRGDAVSDNCAGKLAPDVEVQAGLAAWANDVLDEIHAATRLDPSVAGVGVFRLDHDVEVQEDRTVEGEVPVRGKPRRGARQLVANEQGHGGILVLQE